MPAIVLTMGGRLRAQSVKGERWIDASDFFVGALTTALEPDEMLMEIELPIAAPRSGACFMELSRRRGDFAIIGVACIVRVDEAGKCTEARIGLCNAGDGPVFAAAGEPIACRQGDRRAGHRRSGGFGARRRSIRAAAFTPAKSFSATSPAC